MLFQNYFPYGQYSLVVLNNGSKLVILCGQIIMLSPRIYIYTKIEQWTFFIIYLLDNQEYIEDNVPSEIIIIHVSSNLFVLHNICYG